MSAQIWPCRVEGKASQPGVVFLHGFMGSGADWLPVAKRLADQFYCLMPDLPGHGHNLDRPRTQRLTFDLIAEELCRLLDQLDAGRVNLVGYSMGGRLALYAALRYPKRFRKLVLEGANPGIKDSHIRRERAAVDDRRAERLLRQGIDTFVEEWYDMDLFRTLHQVPSLLSQVKAQRKTNHPEWAAKVIRELSPGRQPPLSDNLDGLSMPVMLVAGALDAKYSVLVTKMGQKIPQATVAIVPDAGHNVHLEQPARFVELAATFFVRG